MGKQKSRNKPDDPLFLLRTSSRGKAPRFFCYDIGNLLFIGDNGDQIRETLDYYNKRGLKDENGNSVHMDSPNDSRIHGLERVVLPYALPILSVDHFLDIKPEEGIGFCINANAVHYIRSVVGNLDVWKRGGLYKFGDSLPEGLRMILRGLNTFFLPKHVMESLRDYNWKQHDGEIRRMLGENLTKVGRHGGIRLRNPAYDR